MANKTSNSEYGGLTIARALKAENVDSMFGIVGAMDLVCEEGEKLGIRHYVTRHEQAGGFAADGYARAARKPGVTFTSTGPGMANALPAMYHAAGANSPVILLSGTTPPIEDGMMAAQEGHPAEVLKGVVKWTHRLLEPATMSYWVRKAFRQSVQPQPGPVVLEIPTKLISMRGTQEQIKYVRNDRVARVPETAGDPASIAEVARAIGEAKRPVIIAADGVYWSDAAAELREFAELMQVPTCTRRTARGAVPETHPLAFTAAYRRGFLQEADLICLIGQSVTGLDEWFEAPDWNENATWIQVQDVADNVWFGIPTDHVVVGSSKLVLRQMIAEARDFLSERRIERTDWLRMLAEVKARIAQRKAETNARLRKAQVVHPQLLAREIASALDGSSTLIYDSFTVSNYLTSEVEASYAGQILDAGLFQTLGHSIGMSIGAQVARPGKPVVSIIGDGGFGIAGMDMETMVRYGLPCVVVLYNNSSFGGRAWAHDLYYPDRNSGELTPGVRYDNMFQAIGCHTEHVVEPGQIRPALDRALASGKPSIVHVVGETDATAAIRQRCNLLDTWSRNNFEELPEEARLEMRSWPKSVFERSSKRARDNLLGYAVPTEELIDMVKPDFARDDR